ncbi:hypothetical protein BJV78DRAFT_1280393 [Lactifluus subvellereus]|nr:hypothetical protein BJV78DRAFT_1280393 [Lactifluus subvellereus]
MEYHPKHPQPFSFSDALRFDPATITEGSVTKYNILWASGFKLTQIARLQNSLRHLKRTQDELRAYNSDDDPELVQALKENEAVIASQEERINILNLALIEKRVVASVSHYELTQTPAAAAPQPPAPPSDAAMDELHDDNDGGVML